MSDGLTIRIQTRGLPTGADADGIAEMLEVLGREAVSVVADARPLPHEQAGSMGTLGVWVDYTERSTSIATVATGHGAYVRRSDATTRMVRRDYAPGGRQPRKSVTIGTELARDLAARVEDLSRALPDNVALAALAEVIEGTLQERAWRRESAAMAPRRPRKRGKRKVG